jgi:hypothetical protein
VTIGFLAWACGKLDELDKRALLLVWDNASWHISQEVKGWIKEHTVRSKEKEEGYGFCPAPAHQKPVAHPIEPRWIHAKRRVMETDRLLSGRELAQRVCDDFGCAYEKHLTLTEKVA